MAELSRVIWKPIPGTCGIYEVSNFGEIRNKTTKKAAEILKGFNQGLENQPDLFGESNA